MKVLDVFESWYAENRSHFEGLGVSVGYVRPEQEGILTPKNSAKISLDSDSFMCDTIIWESGECDVHVLDCVSDKEILTETQRFDSEEEMIFALNRMCTYLTILFTEGIAEKPSDSADG